MLLCIAPMAVAAAEANTAAPRQATIVSYRIVPKEGHVRFLKTAIAAHAAKYHTGEWKWRVYEVLTGAETGSYMILEGPNAWTEIEVHSSPAAECLTDYEDTILPHVEKTLPRIYATYMDDSSTVPANFSSTKILISKGYVKPGRAGPAHDTAKAWKKVYEKLGLDVGMWRTFFSGEDCYIFAGSLKAGFKDLDDSMIDLGRAAEEVLGPGSSARTAESDSANYARVVTEIIEFRPELSSQ